MPEGYTILRSPVAYPFPLLSYLCTWHFLHLLPLCLLRLCNDFSMLRSTATRVSCRFPSAARKLCRGRDGSPSFPTCRLSRHIYTPPSLIHNGQHIQHALHCECLFFCLCCSSSPFHVFKLRRTQAKLTTYLSPVLPSWLSSCLAVWQFLSLSGSRSSQTRKRLTLLIDCSQQLFVLYTAFISS